MLKCTCGVSGIDNENRCLLSHGKVASSDMPCQCDCHYGEKDRTGFIRTARNPQYLVNGESFIKPPGQW